MGLPEIPENKHRPSLKETFIDLLESIALEETAISHLLNAEAEKIQAYVGKCLNFPSHPTNQEIIKFNLSVKQLADTLLMKEWLLLKKLETVSEIQVKIDNHEKGKDEEVCPYRPGKGEPIGGCPGKPQYPCNPKNSKKPRDWDENDEEEEEE